MKIGVVIGHPTQFEGPLFQEIARDPEHTLRVVFVNRARMEKIYDPELGSNVSWGLDLLSGYDHVTWPRRRVLRWLLRELRTQRYDVLIINGYYRFEFVLTTLVAKLFGVPLALRLDTVPYNNASRLRRAWKRGLYLVLSRLYTFFFAIGSLTVEFLGSVGVGRERVALFTYAVDSHWFAQGSRLDSTRRAQLRARFGLPEKNRVILSVAKFNGREAPWDLLRAFCALDEPGAPLSLFLVGDGPDRAALEEFARQHPKSHIVFGGYVPYPELPSIYGISDVFVHAAHDEPWGVSVAEAMSCGLPVIASERVGAAHDLIEPGVNGDVFPTGNAQALQSKLECLLRDWQPQRVREANERLLSGWNYDATWRNIVEAAKRFGNSR